MSEKKEEKKVDETKKGDKAEKKENVKEEKMAEKKTSKKEKAEKEGEKKEIIVPLRRKFMRTPKYKRVPKAIKALKKFIARHMKLRDGDLRKIKIDSYLNEELWFRGIRNPPAKIKVKVLRKDDNIFVELAELPEKAKYKKARETKVEEEIKKKKEAEKSKREAEEKVVKAEEEKTEEEKKEIEEKEKATVEAGLKEAEKKAREIKHETKMKRQPKRQFRQALQK